MTPNLSITLAGCHLANPIMTASGCCGYGEELAEIFPISKLGALVTKTITPEVRPGHPPPRTAETHGGMINAIGLANVGIDRFISEKLPWLSQQKTAVVVNVGGKTVDDYVAVSEALAPYDSVAMIELNFGCPNVNEGGLEFGANGAMAARTVAAVKRVFPRPVIVKLTPNVTSISDIAVAVEDAGADVVSVINSLVGMTVDVSSWKPTVTFNRGGLTGPAILPIAVAMVDACYQRVSIPIIGIGGIASAMDVVQFMLVGASAVQVGTSLFVHPDGPVRILKDLTAYLKSRKLASVTELIGKVEKY